MTSQEQSAEFSAAMTALENNGDKANKVANTLAAMGRELYYRRSRWDQIQWRDHLAQSLEARRAVTEGQQRAATFPALAGELFSRLYDYQPERIESTTPEARWAGQVHATVEDMPEWKELATATAGDEFWSAIGAQGVAAILAGKVPELPQDPQPLRDEVEAVQAMLDAARNSGENAATGSNSGDQAGEVESPTTEQIEARLAAAQRSLDAAEAGAEQAAQQADSGALRNAVRKAVKAVAAQVVEQIEGVRQLGGGGGAGWGNEPGSDAGKLDDATISRAVELLKQDAVKKILKIAGRLRSICARKQATKTKYGRSEIHGITMGSELDRVLPSELVRLCHPVMIRAFKADMAEGRLMTYAMRAKEKQGRGPIVLLIDASVSMRSNDNELWAKALALALLTLAQKQRRSFRAVIFNTACDVLDVGKGDSKAVWMNKVMTWLLRRSNGGTSFEKPISLGMDAISREAQFKRADMVMVTDGICSVSPAFKDRVKEHAKQHEWTAQAIIVGGGQAGSLKDLGFSISRMSSVLDGKAESEAIDGVFSI